MSQLKVGDVVFLNSENDVKMTVVSAEDGEIQCVYFNEVEGKFALTMPMPEDAVRSLTKPNEDFYK